MDGIVRVLRQQPGRNITQADVAEAAGLSEPMISQVERGERPLAPAYFAQLADLLALGEGTRADHSTYWTLAVIVGEAGPVRGRPPRSGEPRQRIELLRGA